MTIGSGIAILGIWLAVAIASRKEETLGFIVAILAVIATLAVVSGSQIIK